MIRRILSRLFPKTYSPTTLIQVREVGDEPIVLEFKVPLDPDDPIRQIFQPSLRMKLLRNLNRIYRLKEVKWDDSSLRLELVPDNGVVQVLQYRPDMDLSKKSVLEVSGA